MKKVLGLSLSALMVASLAGCAGGGPATKNTFTTAYLTDVMSLDYVVTAMAVDHEINANLVDGLLENDQYGKLVPALAETWESNEDATVWTFHLRQGAKWFTSTGDEYAEVTAQDFVTGLQHAADFKSGTRWVVEGVIKNFAEYEEGKVEFSEVGVKAIDEYTVEYTLESSTPYFPSMTTYAILYPVNEAFLNSKGEGCKLGAPDKNACAYGTVDPSSIAYNGAFLLTKNDSKSVQELTKNANYWDVENVHVDTVTRLYDDGKDPYSLINGFEQGTYDVASLRPSWEDFESYKEKYAKNYYETLPNATVFGTNWNFNRQSYEYTGHKTEEEKQKTKDAILNKNFRLAYQHAFDRVAYLEQSAPKDVAVGMLRNIDNFPDIVVDSKGTTYGKLVEEAYNELTGFGYDLSDGQDPYLNKEKAMEFIEAAKADGVKFPVTLDVLAIGDDDQVYINRANSMKKSVEENTEGNILINVILESKDVVNQECYANEVAKDADYDINTFSGWGPDYADPKTFVDIYSTSTGFYMHVIGLELDDANHADSQAVKEKVGFTEYERLYREADAITDDMDARYAAFAKADAYLIANGLYIPQQMDARGYQVSKVVPFTKAYSNTGISEYKFKFMQVQEETVTKEQYDEAKADWDAHR